MSPFATMAILLVDLLLGAGCVSGASNSHARRETGPNIDEMTGKEISHPL
jgi:hypothetical protein